MTWPRLRFGVFAQLALLMGGLAAGSTTLALVIQDRTLSSDLSEAATDRLTGAAAAADRLMSEHLADVAERYAAISTTPEFRANLEAGDHSTLTYHAQRLANRQGATAVAFQSPQGGLVAVAGDEDMAKRAAEQVQSATPAYVVDPPGLFAVAAIPLFTGDDLVGHLVAVEPVGPDVLAAWSEVLGVRVSLDDTDPQPADALVAVARAFPEASVRVATTYEPEQRAISRARRNLTLSGIAAVMLAVLASMSLAHSFARPIKEMKLAAEGVDGESLDAHFDVHRRDELGDLGRAFGDMLNRLRESETRLARAHRLARFSDWWFDLETNTVEAGDDFRRLFALEPESVIEVDDIIKKIHPDDHKKLIDGLERVRASNGAFRTDVRVPMRRGRDRILHLRGQHRPSPGGPARVEASAQDVTERWHSARQIEYLSLHDSITGLGNRQYLFERLGVQLKQAARDESAVAVFLIHLDGFTTVEGAIGHRVGDELLCEVARRLIATLSLPRRHDRHTGREPDASSAVRFGHAEFAAVDTVMNRDEAASLAESLIRTIEEVYVIEDHEISVGASVGISVFPDDATAVDALVRYAKTALQTGRLIPDPYHFYDESMHERQSRRLLVASLLRRAIERQELEVHYQPRVRLEGGTLVAVEALLRWDNHQLDSVSPGEFVPIAEDVGLIQDLGDWCLRAAVHDLLRWQSLGVTGLRVSVNVSPQQLLPTFVDRVLAITAEVDPGSIEFEVTESAVIRNPEEALGLLTQLADYGFRIALDDFGTGYSSMSHLRQLPLDVVKIDRSFIKDLATHEEARSITSAVIMMCQALNLESVAEGVETEPQRERLIELGCDEIQGFLFARPMPATDLEALLKSQGLLPEPETVG